MNNKKTILILILVLTIGLIGLGIAYFSNSTSFENLFSTNPYGSTVTEQFISPDNWLPGDVTEKTIVATNSGNVDQAVRIKITEKWLDSNNNELNGWIHEDGTKSNHESNEDIANDERVAIINFDNNDDWTKVGDYYYYNYKLSPNESTSSLIKSVTFNPKTKLDDTCTSSVSNGKKTVTCNSSGSDYDNATYTLTFDIETVQFNKYASAWEVDVAISEERQLYCDAFEVGELVTYNNQDYYVLKDSSTEDDYLTLIKKDPLTAEEINQYSTTYVSQDGEYPYFESDTCNENDQTGCSTNYDTSDVKKIVDGWSSSFSDDLLEIDGYKTRLISENDIIIRKQINVSSISYELVTDTIEPLLENDNNYWISYTFDDSNVDILGYKETWNGYFNEYRVYEKLYIRPIINVKKSSIINACYLKKSEIVCTNGELVSYDGEDYFVLENSGTDEKYVSLLKIEPLTAEEVNSYSTVYVSQNGEYPYCFEGNNCLKNVKGSGAQILDFSKSDIKKLVDKWSYKYINDLVGKDKYKSRLLTIDEFNNNDDLKLSEKYWSMSTYIYTTHTTISGAYSLSTNIFQEDNVNNKYLVRPVINLHKNAIESGCNVENNNNEQQVEACDINNYNHVSYSIGDTINYNNDDYYVIDNSSADQNYVTLLKVDPLTYNELRKYNNGYDIHNSYGIGLINFYKSDTCTATNNKSGCTTNYNDSFVKIIVDNWSNSIESNLVEINGYKARLLNLDELRDNFGYEYVPKNSWSVYGSSDETPNWLKNNSYSSWTMTPYEYVDYNIYVIAGDYLDGQRGFVADYSAIRPVINLKKCAISN